MYAIIKQHPLTIMKNYDYDDKPNQVIWPNDTVTYAPTIGMTVANNIFVNKVVAYNPPTTLHVANGSTISYDANTFTVTQTMTFSEPLLDDMKETAKNRVLTWRTGKQDSGFEFANVVFQSDPLSRSTIAGAVQMAIISNMTNTAYNVSWTALDNSQHDMDANTVIQFGVTAATVYQELHIQAVALKNQIDSANDAAGIQSILNSVGA